MRYSPILTSEGTEDGPAHGVALEKEIKIIYRYYPIASYELHFDNTGSMY